MSRMLAGRTRCALGRGATALLLLLVIGTAAAQSYPKRPVRFVVPFAAGGSTDIVARAVGAQLTPMLGQSVRMHADRSSDNIAMGIP